MHSTSVSGIKLVSGGVRLGSSLLRVGTIGTLQALTLLLLDRLVPGVHIAGWQNALWFVAVVALLNAILWPVLSYFTVPLAVFSLGLFTILLNFLILWIADLFSPGVDLRGFWTYPVLVLALTVVTILFSSLLTVDDDLPFYRSVVLREAKRRSKIRSQAGNGVVFLEIDGLAAPILVRAVHNGYMPTLARWLDEGSYRLIRWEPDLSSQTAASQAGILLGDNFNIPAFRWYERDSKRLMVSSRPQVAGEVERRLSSGSGLLASGGASCNNMFSGDAHNTLLTMSTVLDRWRASPSALYGYFAYPYNVARLFILFAGDVMLELWQAWRQRRRDVRPRLGRRGRTYPLIRACTTVVMRELTVYSLMADMFEGVPVVYATFVAYDEVAHHSGIERPEALDMLAKLDRQFARIEKAAAVAPRHYRLVVLSDHGQSQGATFKQRYGQSLDDLVRSLVAEDTIVSMPVHGDEAWGNINVALTQGLMEENQAVARLLHRTVRGRMEGDTVALGPERRLGAAPQHKQTDVLVLASGNLGLIYFTDEGERQSLEEIQAAHPALIAGLIQHPGIGFVLVRSEEHGPLAIGARGVYYLRDGRYEGENSLEPFGEHAVTHLLRADSFPHVADIMVNSTYDADWDEIAAFEELVGSHGGLGGTQTEPFVLAPVEWKINGDPIVGVRALHELLKTWVSKTTGEVAAPTPVAADAGVSAQSVRRS